MPDVPSSSSFIPKRTQGTKVYQKRTKSFFLLSIVSYACLIAAPTASAAVYVYQLYTERQFDQIVTELDEAIGGFSEAEMARVLEFDNRLRQATILVNNHVSVARVFDILETQSASNIGFTGLSLKRNGDASVAVEAEIIAPNFDTALFQRGVYMREDNPIDVASLSDITFVPPNEQGVGERVTMSGSFAFSQESIAFTVTDTVPAATANDLETPDADSSDTTIESTEASGAVSDETL